MSAHFAGLQYFQSIQHALQSAFADFHIMRLEFPSCEESLSDAHELVSEVDILLRPRFQLQETRYIDGLSENGDHGGEDTLDVLSWTLAGTNTAVSTAWLGSRESIGAEFCAVFFRNRVPGERELVVRIFTDLRGGVGGIVVEGFVGSKAFDVGEVAG